MIIHWKKSTRLLTILALGAWSAGFTAFSAWAVSPTNSNSAEVRQDWIKQRQQERQEWFKHYTDHMADRLEIKASQQGAWQAYTKTLEAAGEHPLKKPEMKNDAASIARLRADMAAAHAQKLAQIADATAKLQDVLSPDQRKTFDQIVFRSGWRHHGFHGGENGWHGRHGEGGRDHGDQWNHGPHEGGSGSDHDH